MEKRKVRAKIVDVEDLEDTMDDIAKSYIIDVKPAFTSDGKITEVLILYAERTKKHKEEDEEE